MPIDSVEKRPYYVLIETNNALEGKTMKRRPVLKAELKLPHWGNNWEAVLKCGHKVIVAGRNGQAPKTASCPHCK